MYFTFADITLPLWLVVSQWTLLFAFGFLVILMYRQIAFLEQMKDRGSEREGLPVGEKAAAFDYKPARQSGAASLHFDPVGRWSFLLFADPTCSSCQGALLALEQLAPKLAQSMQVLVATTAEPALVAASDAFQLASVEIGRIPADISTRLYRTNVTPFGYLIDPEGVVRAKGVATDEASMRKIVRQGDRKPVNVEFVIP